MAMYEIVDFDPRTGEIDRNDSPRPFEMDSATFFKLPERVEWVRTVTGYEPYRSLVATSTSSPNPLMRSGREYVWTYTLSYVWTYTLSTDDAN